MKRLLWIGDACCDSGFARATHYTLRGLDYRLNGDMECSVLGLNHLGDKNPYPYDVYTCWSGGDPFGINRLRTLVPRINPDVIVIQNDPWNIPRYMETLREFSQVPVVGLIAVDGYNCVGGRADGKTPREQVLNALDLCIFWTEFGRQQARLGGYEGPSTVVPLGVDRTIYHPYDRAAARDALKLPLPDDAFIICNVNRNQPRKRMDLTLFIFREWLLRYKHSNAALILHSAPTGDAAINLKQLVDYLGLSGKVFLSTPDPREGMPESDMVKLYSGIDLLMSTSQTEGFSLPTIEAMACGTPVVVPALPVFQEWATGAAVLVPCSHSVCSFNGINVIGQTADLNAYVDILEDLYERDGMYNSLVQNGLERAAEPRFDWANIGTAVHDAIVNTLWPVREEQPVG